MIKPAKEYSSIKIDGIRSIRGHCLRKLMRGKNKIPDYAGIYVWRYWPDIPSLDSDNLKEFIKELQDKFPQHLENIKNSRVDISVKRTPFGSKNDGRLLGIKSEDKINKILKTLDGDKENRQVFAHTLEILISSFPPIYIGKADNLQKRLTDHFEYRTDVLRNIEDADISIENVYISFIKDDLSNPNMEVSTGIEEILQRLTNPVFTKRYG